MLLQIRVRITRPDGTLVYEHPAAGPWLLIDLPPGRYRVQPGPALEGDTVTLEYDGGTTETVKVLGGRRYLYQPGSDILYLNQHPKPTPGG